MPDDPAKRSKRAALKRHGTLNPHPDAVTDPLFHTGDFFDPADLLQVKYEMLRRVEGTRIQSASPLRHSASPVPLTIKPKPIFSALACWGCCPKNEDPVKATSSRRTSWTSRPNSVQATLAAPLGPGGSHSGPLRHNGPSAQYRTRTGPAGKKTPLNPASAPNTAMPQTLISAYEDLRERVDGLRVLEAWVWLSFLVKAWWPGCRHAPGYPPLVPITRAGVRRVARPLPNDLRGEIVLVLAAMALNQAPEVRP